MSIINRRDPFQVAANVIPSNRGILWRIREFFAWAGPEVSQKTNIAQYLEREKIRSGPQDIKLPWFLPYQDDTGVEETQAMRHAYRRMYADPVITAALNSQIFGVASLPLQIHPADKKNKHDVAVAEFHRWNLQRRLSGGPSGLIWNILSGMCVDGYSINETVITYQDKGKYEGKDVLVKLKQKDAGNDVVLNTDQFRNIVSVLGLRYNSGVEFHASDFVIGTRLKMYERPTGLSAFRCVYHHYWLRDTAWKLRQIGLSTKSFPVLVGYYANADTQPSLNNSLTKAKSLAWLSVPESCRIEALELAGQSKDAFSEAIQGLNEEIFLGITGATLQALTGDSDEHIGKSSVHATTSNLNKWFYSENICGLFNDQEVGILKNMTDLNFVVGDYPFATLSAVEPDDIVKKVTIATGIKALGLDQSRESLHEELATEPPHDNDPADVLPGDKPGQTPPTPPAGGMGTGNDDTGLGGAGTPPFRFSEAWSEYVR